MRRLALNTVCDEALCPNRGECWAKKTATFMILGTSCTRACGFCSIKTARGEPVDPTEPERVAQAALELGLSYVVITSVNRDDLPDGGAEQFCKAVWAIKRMLPEAKVEVLVPDFLRKEGAVERVLECPIFCFAHNIETVPRLYARVRPGADYRHSLNLLRTAASRRKDIFIKSGMMVGHGETWQEVLEVMQDLRQAGVQVLTVGQYLQPTKAQLPVREYKDKSFFEKIEQVGKALGFKHVFSGALVRSSYRAWEQVAYAG